MGRRLVESVPNFSEGRDSVKVDAIAEAIRGTQGALVLDTHLDADHNRSVITFVAPPERIVAAAVSAAEQAAILIDLNQHQGVHPRIGALDVLPFIPLEGVTIEDCVAIAEAAASELWGRLRIPSYFYEAAARNPERGRLENLRRGQFEGLRKAVLTDPERRPDTGGPEFHPTAGATAIGARPFLIAYNINLTTPDLAAAHEIAKRVRTSGGGLPHLKAMGLLLAGRNVAQVSMNLTDFERTPLHVVFTAVQKEAERLGVTIAGSELVGLVPRRAIEMTNGFDLRWENYSPLSILENRIAKLESD